MLKTAKYVISINGIILCLSNFILPSGFNKTYVRKALINYNLEEHAQQLIF